ncbi:hypothetical protein WR25_23853 [Diploscapter pachys]|uniref:Phospholipase B-like n=1 Tax=Diploscapter pachys TaxID=2018661 RepID=A0A2A2J4Y4_9BILA|nr:hypothetical protein WR25_23853 [Diploscapter pachys]
MRFFWIYIHDRDFTKPVKPFVFPQPNKFSINRTTDLGSELCFTPFKSKPNWKHSQSESNWKHSQSKLEYRHYSDATVSSFQWNLRNDPFAANFWTKHLPRKFTHDVELDGIYESAYIGIDANWPDDRTSDEWNNWNDRTTDEWNDWNNRTSDEWNNRNGNKQHWFDTDVDHSYTDDIQRLRLYWWSTDILWRSCGRVRIEKWIRFRPNALKAVGYVIITIGHGTPNNFSALASDPSYAFSIYPNDPPNYADEAKVSAAVSNILVGLSSSCYYDDPNSCPTSPNPPTTPQTTTVVTTSMTTTACPPGPQMLAIAYEINKDPLFYSVSNYTRDFILNLAQQTQISTLLSASNNLSVIAFPVDTFNYSTNADFGQLNGLSSLQVALNIQWVQVRTQTSDILSGLNYVSKEKLWNDIDMNAVVHTMLIIAYSTQGVENATNTANVMKAAGVKIATLAMTSGTDFDLASLATASEYSLKMVYNTTNSEKASTARKLDGLIGMKLRFLSIFLYVAFVHSQRHEREYSFCEDSFGNWLTVKQIPGSGENSYEKHHCHKHLAKIHYLNDINQTGWAYLETDILDDSLSHWKQGYIAGYMEGHATRDLIALQIRNTLSDYCDGAEKYCKNLSIFLKENLKWMIKEVHRNLDDPYWRQIALTLFQYKGIHDAYYHKKPMVSDTFDIDMIDGSNDEDDIIDPIMLLQLAGDLEDLQGKFKKPENLRRPYSVVGSHCSALVKLLPDHSDLYFSHVTWSSYSGMLRMQKKYAFKTGDPGQEYAFSGYPGTIASVDDFIVTSSKLAVLETTIANYNEELNSYIKPNTVLCWIRTQVAHRTSSTAADWANTFAKHNSGTYNNEWVVVDYKRFRRGYRHQKDYGIIQVVEQLPHFIVHADMTKELLESTYWPGYNTPYFSQIQRESQMQKMIDKFGDWYT